jgi:putative ABC transport system ATP-binding protein
MKNNNNSLKNNKTGKDGFVQLHNVSMNYHTPAGDFLALDRLNLKIKEGEFVSIVGKSGSGKSTLINMITGIDQPTSGNVVINGRDIQGQNEGEMALWRGKNMGIVFQFFQLLPMLSVLENTMLPMDFCNQYEFDKRETIALNLLQRLGLRELANQSPLEISGGHQQCAAIARALANDPPVLLADEPTGNLDSKTAEMVLNIFEDLKKRDKTIIMVTHDKILAERADRVLILSDGRLISEELSSGFPNISDFVLAEIDKCRKKIVLKPGESIPSEWSGAGWFGYIETGSLLTQSGRFKRLFYKEVPYIAGEVFELRSNVKLRIAAEESVIWLVPSKERSELPANEVDQINYILQAHRKEQDR